MRVQRFETFLAGLIRTGADQPVRDMQTFAEAGFTGAGDHGLILTMGNGARLYLNMVGSAPAGGDDHNQPEKIVEGEPPVPDGEPALQLQPDGRVRTVDVETWLRALLLSSRSPEIREVRAYSRGEGSGFHPYGITVVFHRGDATHLYFLHTLPKGAEPWEANRYQPLEAI